MRPRRRNADETLRRLERAAAGGDPLARQELLVWKLRSGAAITDDEARTSDAAWWRWQLQRRARGEEQYVHEEHGAFRGERVWWTDPTSGISVHHRPDLDMPGSGWVVGVFRDDPSQPWQLNWTEENRHDDYSEALADAEEQARSYIPWRLGQSDRAHRGEGPPHLALNPRRRNPDDELRRLERAAAAGDEQAWWRWTAERLRRGDQPVLRDQLVIGDGGVHGADVWPAGPNVGVAVYRLGLHVRAVLVEQDQGPGTWSRTYQPVEDERGARLGPQQSFPAAPVAVAPAEGSGRGFVEREAQGFALRELRRGLRERAGRRNPNGQDPAWVRAMATVPPAIRAGWNLLPPAQLAAKEQTWYHYWTQVLRHRPDAGAGPPPEADVPHRLRNPQGARETPDSYLRRLERAAAGGDAIAGEELVQARRRWRTDEDRAHDALDEALRPHVYAMLHYYLGYGPIGAPDEAWWIEVARTTSDVVAHALRAGDARRGEVVLPGVWAEYDPVHNQLSMTTHPHGRSEAAIRSGAPGVLRAVHYPAPLVIAAFRRAVGLTT